MLQNQGQNQQCAKGCGLATQPLRCGACSMRHSGRLKLVPHKWADWLHNPFSSGGSSTLQGGDKIKSGPQEGGLAT